MSDAAKIFADKTSVENANAPIILRVLYCSRSLSASSMDKIIKVMNVAIPSQNVGIQYGLNQSSSEKSIGIIMLKIRPDVPMTPRWKDSSIFFDLICSGVLVIIFSGLQIHIFSAFDAVI